MAADVDDSTEETAGIVCETLQESGKADETILEEVENTVCTAGSGLPKHPTSKADLCKNTIPNLKELTDPNGNIGLPT